MLTLITPLCVHSNYTFVWLISVCCYIHQVRLPVLIIMLTGSVVVSLIDGAVSEVIFSCV